MIDKVKLLKDLEFCKELLNRTIKYTEKNYMDGTYYYGNNHTVIQQDLRRLRRELNDINHKLDWNYKE